VRENVAISYLPEINNDELVDSVLKKTEAYDFIHKLPKGLDTLLGTYQRGGVGLSGGQYQRVALARAIFRPASLLVLDEPTSAVDAESEEKIFNTIFSLDNNPTILLISHRFSTIAKAEEVIVMQGGKIVEKGPLIQLLRDRGRFFELFVTQTAPALHVLRQAGYPTPELPKMDEVK
jgi:ABC-type multidrug transport system fused ATPase/permease subunit